METIFKRSKRIQAVESAVSKIKFDHETKQFLSSSDIHRRRGIVVLDSAFPDFKVGFCAPQIKPAPFVFAVTINFTNYDLEPLSVKFIDPFTFDLIQLTELNHAFNRKVTGPNGAPVLQPLALGLSDGTPFICLPGIHEYHEHPDHSNDPWLSRRGKGGEGTLGFIIEKLYEYGIVSLNGLLIQFQATAARMPLSIDLTKVPS